MALQENKISVAFNQGVDTKSDPKQVRGKLLVLQNAYFQTLQKIRKRNGYIALPSLGAGVMLCTYNNELVSLDGSSLYSYNSNGASQTAKGSLPTVSLSTQTVVRNTFQQTVQDSAINGTIQCFTWLDSIGSVNYSVFDTATGQSIVNNAVVSATGAYAKVLSVGSYFVIIYYDTGDDHLRYRAINTATPTSIGSATDIATDINTTTPCWDATVINGSIYLCYNNASAELSLYSISSTLTRSSQKNFGSDNANVISIFGDASFNVWVAYAINGGNGTNTNIDVFALNAALSSTVLAKTNIDGFQISSVGPNINTMTGIVTGTTATIYYEVVQTDAVIGDGINLIRSNTVTTSAVIGTAGVFNRGVGLAAKAFVYSGSYYLLLATESNLQPTYFLVRSDGIWVAKLAPSSGGGYATEPILPEINVVSSGVFQTASLIKDSLTVQNGVIATQTGVQSGQFTFTAVAPSKFLLGNNLHIMGAMPKMYDGGSVVEHSFNLYPEGVYTTWDPTNPTFGGGVGIGASIAAVNQKQYCAVYEWTDNQGQSHQSAPSIPINVSIPANQTLTYITGTITTSGPSHSGNTITSISGGSPVNGQYINLVTASGAVTFCWNATITVSGTTITTSSNYEIVSGSYSFIISDNPLNLYFLNAQRGGTLVAGFSTVGNCYPGQILTCPTGLTTQFPPGTYFTSISPGWTAQAGFSTNNPLTGTGTSRMYFAQDSYEVPLNLPTLKVTNKNKVSIAVYATLVNGTVFYRASSPTSLIYNDPTVDYVSFTDTTADSFLLGNQELYTTSGEVDNIAAPAALFSFTYRSRSVLIPSESSNGPSFWFSKQVIPGTPVEYNNSFVQNVDARIGSITAGGAMDDKMILFGPTSKFYVVGDGPSDNGQNNDFTEATKIAGNTGCANPASVIEIKDGLFYQDPTKGIWLLDRSLQEHYIGSDVEGFNGYTVTSAQLIEGVTQVRFTLSNGTALVYDYVSMQWSVFLNHSAVDSCIFQGLYTFLSAAGAIWQESPGAFTDPGTTAVLLGLTSGWIQMDDVQGFERIYQMLFLGTYYSPHTITCQVYLNFLATASQTTIASIPAVGTPQFRLFMANQKCEALQIQLQESQPMGSYGQGFDLSNVAMLVGQKRGPFKVPAAVSYG